MATITTNLLLSLFTQCAIDVAPETLHTVIRGWLIFSGVRK